MCPCPFTSSYWHNLTSKWVIIPISLKSAKKVSRSIWMAPYRCFPLQHVVSLIPRTSNQFLKKSIIVYLELKSAMWNVLYLCRFFHHSKSWFHCHLGFHCSGCQRTWLGYLHHDLGKVSLKYLKDFFIQKVKFKNFLYKCMCSQNKDSQLLKKNFELLWAWQMYQIIYDHTIMKISNANSN